MVLTCHDESETLVQLANYVLNGHLYVVELESGTTFKIVSQQALSIRLYPRFSAARVDVFGVSILPLNSTPELRISLRVTPFESSGITKTEIPSFPGPPVRTTAVQ